MTRTEEILGGWASVCDNCESEDGQPSLFWPKKDFHLCFECLRMMFFQHIAPEYKSVEVVRTVRMGISEKLRNEILDKHNHSCVSCGSTDKLEIDHIMPFSLGGKTDNTNLQVLCKPCNLKKRNKI